MFAPSRRLPNRNPFGFGLDPQWRIDENPMDSRQYPAEELPRQPDASVPTASTGERSWGDRLGDMAMSLGAAQAFIDGNFDGGGKLLMASKERARAAKKALMTAEQQQQIFADLRSQGYSPAEARLMALNPEAIGTNTAERLGSYSLGKGDVRYNGGRVVAERADTFETPMGDRYNLTADGATRQVYREESPVYQNVDGVGVFAMDRHNPGIMGGGMNGGGRSGPPSAAIEALRANPGLAAEFERKYRVSADAYLGGGAGDGTGNFRPSGNPLTPPRFRR